ncbi:MAG: hypothetical protein ACP5VR_11230 [Acidimicrobiales bacterium]
MAQLDLTEAMDPAYLADLEKLPIDELRARRAACAELEVELSYLRRLAQARIDLVLDESERRRRGEPEPEREQLVERLARVLGEHDRSQGPGRLPAFLAPAEEAQLRLAARAEELLPSGQLATLSALPSARLGELLGALSQLERSVSNERRSLHDILDRLQEELVRRYRSGEATVVTLLG